VVEIVIDAKCLQSAQHLQGIAAGQTVSRLTSFLKIIRPFGTVRFTDVDAIDATTLADADVLIGPTRISEFPYIEEEIDSIHNFVTQGGSLLLMSNHSRSPSNPSARHHTEQDGRLAEAFRVQILEAAFRDQNPESLSTISRADTQVHPVLLDESGAQAINAVKINNCSAISNQSMNGRPILFLNDGMDDIGPNGFLSDGQAFAWAIDDYGIGNGRVVLTADSGFIGEPDLSGSGPGLMDKGHNADFVRQTVAWLLSRT
jgi:hypothetical protein